MGFKILKTFFFITISSLLVVALLAGCDFLDNNNSSEIEANSSEKVEDSSFESSDISDLNSNDESEISDISNENSSETSSEDNSIEESEEESREPLIPPPVQGKDLHGLSVEETNAFFDDCVMIGDSFMEGFKTRYQSMGGGGKYFGKITFLASRNFGFLTSHLDMSGGRKTYHPVYQGEQRYVWDVVEELKPARVFIMLGLNDLEGKDATIYTRNAMNKLLAKIKDASPESEIVMISVPYYTKEGERPEMYRTTEIYRNWNEDILKYCNDNEYDFINLSDSMVGEDGYLDPKYAGADGLHFKTTQYYDIWLDYLRGYAADKILNQYVNVETVLWKQ